MPITNIHEEVALNISKQINNLDTKDFYLGNYAPDSVNLNSLAEKSLRWTAHQRKENRNEWRKSLKKFYNEEKNNYPKNFILGYITHILTDIIYDDFFYDDVTKQIKKDYPNEKDTHSIMGEDMAKYAYHSKYKTKVEEVLKDQDKFYDILNISKDMMYKYKEKVLNERKNSDTNIYITEDLIQKLSNKVLTELQEYIED